MEEFDNYFQAYNDYFWEVDKNNSSHENDFLYQIPSGNSIAHIQYVKDILKILSEDGLPPFGSLLLVVLATNSNGKEAISAITKYIEKKEILQLPNSSFFRFGASLDFLNILASLPETYKTGTKRLHLFQLLFKNSHNKIASSRAKKILANLEHRLDFFVENKLPLPFQESILIKDFKVIALLKNKFPLKESIIKAFANDDSTLQEEIIQEELKENDDSKIDLIQQLIANDKTFHIGSLIKNLWSGLSLPMHHYMSNEMPLGGISDLTNKGDLDKLLISEFAYDNDLFISRIANNEALYVQRDIPPQANSFYRFLLIDTSILNWGNCKNIAMALALAIAKHPKTDIQCQIIALGEDWKTIEFDTIHQIIDANYFLSNKLEVSHTLESFLNTTDFDLKNAEVFLLTSDNSYVRPEMQKTIHEYYAQINYECLINSEGVIKIYKHHNKHRKEIQKIYLPIKELWSKQKATSTYSLLSNIKFPILFPLHREYHSIFSDNDNFYIVQAKKLYRFESDEFKKGFTLLAEDLPIDKAIYAIKSISNGEQVLYFYNYQRGIVSYNLKTKIEKENGSIKVLSNNFSFFNIDNQIFFARPNQISIVDDDLNLLPVKKMESKKEEYDVKLASFVRGYKISRPKYSMIKDISSIFIHENEFYINKSPLRHNKFHDPDRFVERLLNLQERFIFKVKVSLILKRVGPKPLQIIKTIQLETNVSLQEADKIVNGNLETILKEVSMEQAENLKNKLELQGATCYVVKTGFTTQDGSRVHGDNGILTFKSSNETIPTFYIPFVKNMELIMATSECYTGNAYFLPTNSNLQHCSYDKFYMDFIAPFIKTILDYVS